MGAPMVFFEATSLPACVCLLLKRLGSGRADAVQAGQQQSKHGDKAQIAVRHPHDAGSGTPLDGQEPTK